MLSPAAQEKLELVDSVLAGIVIDAERIIPLTVIEGHRDQAAQEQAFAEGKTTKHWPDGKHNSLPSRAVDLAPTHHEGTNIVKIDWQDLIAFGRIMGVVLAIAVQKGVMLRFGLDWDGDFLSVNRDPNEHLLDAPHVELL